MCSQTKSGTILAICVVSLALIVLSALIVSRATLAVEPDATSAIQTGWHTFLGSEPASPGDSDDDRGYGVAVDGSGHAYAVGQSINGEWGSTPVVTHALGLDGFLAKLDGDGALLWHTFVGGSETDSARAVTTDDAGSLFVVGTSNGGVWSTDPISDAHGFDDAFAARFDLQGVRQWFTFIGTGNPDYGHAIDLDAAGNIYVGGKSIVNPYLAKLNSAGEFQWQRVITSTSGDLGSAQGIAVDPSGNVYLAGSANYGDWHGAPPPVRPHSGYPGQSDAFVAKFDGDDGSLLWHTFLGAADFPDEGYALVIDSGQAPPALYAGGRSAAGWGPPVEPHSGFSDAFVARLNGQDGTLVWHTFMGEANGGDEIRALTLGNEGRLLAAGPSRNEWGRPVIPHPGGSVGDAAFVVALSVDGHLLGNTFLGGAVSDDMTYGVAATDQGDIYVAGTSHSPTSVGWDNPYWGTPIRVFRGTQDAFVAGLGIKSVVRTRIYLPMVVRD